MTKRLWGIALLGAFLLVPVHAGNIITTNYSTWDGTSYTEFFGIPNSQSYGQVVTAPTGATTLDSFAFWLKLPDTLAFRGGVYAWDGTKATGPNLWQSGPVTTANSTAFEKVLFSTGSVSVTEGQQYILFITSSLDNPGHSGRGQAAASSPMSYPDGKFYFQNNGDDPSMWTEANWTSWKLAGNLVFEATFGNGVSEVPEPGTLALVPLGLVALGLVRRYRRA